MCNWAVSFLERIKVFFWGLVCFIFVNWDGKDGEELFCISVIGSVGSNLRVFCFFGWIVGLVVVFDLDVVGVFFDLVVLIGEGVFCNFFFFLFFGLGWIVIILILWLALGFLMVLVFLGIIFWIFFDCKFCSVVVFMIEDFFWGKIFFFGFLIWVVGGFCFCFCLGFLM